MKLRLRVVLSRLLLLRMPLMVFKHYLYFVHVIEISAFGFALQLSSLPMVISQTFLVDHIHLTVPALTVPKLNQE